jgi:hypothetical protein
MLANQRSPAEFPTIFYYTLLWQYDLARSKVMSIDTLPGLEEQDTLTLTAGPRWDSFEQFRTGGPRQLQDRLGPGVVGRLKVKDQDYVIMRSQTFSRLYGLAQEVRRLGHGLLLIRQAVQLVLQTNGARVAIEHLRDLTLRLPDQPAERLTLRELTFDADERTDDPVPPAGEPDFELDPAKIARPVFKWPE